MHSHDYKGDDPDLFRDKTVVVLGMGNSAMDIAVEASFVADAHVPRRAPRRARDPQVPVRQADSTRLGGSRRSRSRSAGRLFQGMLKVYLGDMERYGLPKPDHRFGDAHPTISDDILSRMAHGDDHARSRTSRR